MWGDYKFSKEQLEKLQSGDYELVPIPNPPGVRSSYMPPQMIITKKKKKTTKELELEMVREREQTKRFVINWLAFLAFMGFFFGSLILLGG